MQFLLAEHNFSQLILCVQASELFIYIFTQTFLLVFLVYY